MITYSWYFKYKEAWIKTEFIAIWNVQLFTFKEGGLVYFDPVRELVELGSVNDFL